MKQEKAFVRSFIKWTTVLNFLALVVLAIAQAYARWKLNQNFTFLGDWGFPALVGLFAAQLFALIHTERS